MYLHKSESHKIVRRQYYSVVESTEGDDEALSILVRPTDSFLPRAVSRLVRISVRLEVVDFELPLVFEPRPAPRDFDFNLVEVVSLAFTFEVKVESRLNKF